MFKEITLSEALETVSDIFVGTKIEVIEKDKGIRWETRLSSKLKSFNLVGNQIDVFGYNTDFEMHFQAKDIRKIKILPEISEIHFVFDMLEIYLKPAKN